MEAKKAPRAKKADKKEEDFYQIQENTNHSIRYLYTTFDGLKEQGEYNFYGVVLDASFPLEEQNTSKYSCTLKLIDQTTNCLTNPNNFNDNIIYLTIKSSEKEKYHISTILVIL